MQIIVFEDEHVSRLHPVTVGRAAYAIGCGSFRLIDWLAQLSRDTGVVLRGVVRPHLEAIQALDFPQIRPTAPTLETPAAATKKSPTASSRPRGLRWANTVSPIRAKAPCSSMKERPLVLIAYCEDRPIWGPSRA